MRYRFCNTQKKYRAVTKQFKTWYNDTGSIFQCNPLVFRAVPIFTGLNKASSIDTFRVASVLYEK
jgi:hypothetical protein